MACDATVAGSVATPRLGDCQAVPPLQSGAAQGSGRQVLLGRGSLLRNHQELGPFKCKSWQLDQLHFRPSCNDLHLSSLTLDMKRWRYSTTTLAVEFDPVVHKWPSFIPDGESKGC